MFLAFRLHRSNFTVLAPVLAFIFLSGIGAAKGHAQTAPDYARDVAPILSKTCAPCHNASLMQAQFRVDSVAYLLKGGLHGAAIVPGHSGDSLLVKRILGLGDEARMPLGLPPLSTEQTATIRAWIDRGKVEAAPNAPELTTSNPVNSAASPVFAEKIRPLLASRCYGCHGAETQQNGLRVDSLAALLKGSESGRIIVPGHSDQSRLMRRLQAQERPSMPYGGPALSASEIGTIKSWIDSGAPGPDSTEALNAIPGKKHWAYERPVRPSLPAVRNSQWPRNDIDRFILARLEREGLDPRPEANKRTLVRRVYLDLVGLPPSPKEVDAFLADKNPDAYEKLVNRLLASPQYGERWARPWLDLARYADTNGYEKDGRRTAWAYRDWVIKALNANMSFKEFTIEQIAGDLLPHPTNDQLIATGFHRNTMLNREGGVDPEEYYWYEQVDRVNTTASVFLGSTLGCAQCHNHKFDPFTQKDYYKFLAFFANGQYEISGDPNERWAKEPDLYLPTPEQAAKSTEIKSKIEVLKQVLATSTPELERAQVLWEGTVKAEDAKWRLPVVQRAESAGGATLQTQSDGSLLVSGKNPQADTYTVALRLEKGRITALRLEVMNDASLPNRGPGRDPDGNFFLSDFEAQVAAPGEVPRSLQLSHVSANDEQGGYPAKNILVKEAGAVRGWAINPEAPYGTPHRLAVFALSAPLDVQDGTILTLRLKHFLRHSARNIGRFRVTVSDSADAMKIAQLPADLWPILSIPPESRNTKATNALRAGYRGISPVLDSTRKQIAALEDDLEKLGIVTTQIMAEKDVQVRPVTYIRERGSFLSKGEQVAAGVPSVLPPLQVGVIPNRLALAQWLVSDDNPLTARVTVNRFWETIFGRGLVETSEDFGTQGELPSHPELLDWLAVEFMNSGWDMKRMQRLMVTSATYRQSSNSTPDLIAKDPYNRLYARGPRFRLEGEIIHDVALSDGGLLSNKMYGPSVFPYQPEGIWDVPYSSDKWVMSQGEDRYRRALYTFARRSAPYPSLVTFDGPSREFCTVRRVRTNTPLQALTALNDPFFFESARGMARRMQQHGTTDAERLGYGFQIALSRPPTRAESDYVLAFYREQLAQYQKDPAAAARVMLMKEADATAPEQAALTLTANVLLNMDEALTKE